MSSQKKPNPYVKAIAPTKAPAAAKTGTKPAAVNGKGKTTSNGVRKEDKDALRADVLALGGDEAELEMLLAAESDSEIEGEPVAPKKKDGKSSKAKATNGDDDVDPTLAKDLRNLLKSLDFSTASVPAPAALEEEEEEEELEGEEEEESGESSSESESESEDSESSSSAEEEEEAVAAPAVAAKPAVTEKKESKYEREERRKAERALAKEKELEEKSRAKESKPAVKPINIKSPWIVDPTPQWYAVPLPTLPSLERPSPSTIADLKTQAVALLKRDNDLYSSSLAPRPNSAAPPPPNGLSKADQVFIQQILTSGTSSDKISALLLLASSSPLHTMTYLDQLSSMSKKKSREESGKVVRGVVDWWRGGGGDGGGAPSRKLKTFADQPGLGAISKAVEAQKGKGKSAGSAGLEVSQKDVELCLTLWAFEDWLKTWFFEILKSLEQMSVDPLPHPRTQAVLHLSNLLRDKPEQESNILRLLVNKLGDSQRSIASKTSYHLLQILQYHPGMTPILVREVSALILRPAVGAAPSSHVRFGKEAQKAPAVKDTGHDHAKYYGIITLNQVVLTRAQSEVAGKMIDVYFQIFGDILGRLPEAEAEEEEEDGKDEKRAGGGEKRKRGGGKPNKRDGKGEKKGDGEVGEADSKLVAAVLTGVNRAFPFAKLDDEAFKRRLDVLFRITHTGTFNVSIQALLLIYHVSAAKKDISDRFYRTLYASLFDYRLAGSSKQALYLNLVLKATKQDSNAQRVAAFVKRLVQVMLGMEVTFILGSIWIVGELIATVPGLRKILTEAESVTPTSAESTTTLPESEETRSTAYDGKKREPQFANAQNSCLWEIVPLLHHYHPSVALHAEQLLDGQPISSSMDLEQHSLTHFLDRFVYREAKKVAPTKGSSMMQPGLAGQDRSGRIVVKKGPSRGEEAVNTEAFKGKDESDIPVDQLFFHKYFTNKTSRSDDKAKASKKRKSRKGKGDASSDEESIADLGFSEDEGQLEELDAAMADGEEDEEDDEAEAEIYKAMKASMANDEGDDEMIEDDDSADDLAAYDYSDSEEEGAEGTFKSAFAEEDEFDGLDDDDAGLAEDEDDILGSDEDMPMFEDDDEEDEDVGATKKRSSKSQERQKKKQKLKHLPTFATAEDYAHLLGDDDEDDEE